MSVKRNRMTNMTTSAVKKSFSFKKNRNLSTYKRHLIFLFFFLFLISSFLSCPHPVFGAQGRAEAAEKTVAEICDVWKEGTVQQPKQAQLVPAGPIEVKWNALNNIKNEIVSYRIYLNDIFVKEVSAADQDTFCDEVYSSETALQELKIVAVLDNEKTVTSNIRRFFTSKKGLGIGAESKNAPFDMSLSWYYNWSFTPDSRIKGNPEFVPMVWGAGSYGEGFLKSDDRFSYRTVLGYNEPDRTDQANLPAATAAANQDLFTNSGLRVGAPAVSYPPAWGNEWFKSYVKLVNMDDIDFIPVHCYLDWAVGTADTFLSAIDKTYELYNKPIWITEFAVARWDFSYFDGTNEQTNKEVQDFMKDVLNGLEERDFVERYAWQQFDYGDPYGGSSCLFSENGSLTALGAVYRGAGNPEGYVLPELNGKPRPQKVQDEYVPDGWEKDPVEETTVPSEPESYMVGDVYRDGKITMKDVIMVQKHLAYIIELDKIELLSADANQDGVVSMYDALLIQKYIVKMLPEDAFVGKVLYVK